MYRDELRPDAAAEKHATPRQRPCHAAPAATRRRARRPYPARQAFIGGVRGHAAAEYTRRRAARRQNMPACAGSGGNICSQYLRRRQSKAVYPLRQTALVLFALIRRDPAIQGCRAYAGSFCYFCVRQYVYFVHCHSAAFDFFIAYGFSATYAAA